MRNTASFEPIRRSPVVVVALTVVAIAAVLGGSLALANRPAGHPTQVAAAGAGTAGPVAASSSPTSLAAVTGAPVPAAATFTCSSASSVLTGHATSPVSAINALRTASHAGYDRLTLQFAAGAPTTARVQPQAGTAFTLAPSGLPTSVKGRNGILVTLYGSDIHTAYSGPRDIVTGYPGLAEVRVVQDFEGVVQLAIGTNGPACFQAFMLSAPSRLVVDVQS